MLVNELDEACLRFFAEAAVFVNTVLAQMQYEQ